MPAMKVVHVSTYDKTFTFMATMNHKKYPKNTTKSRLNTDKQSILARKPPCRHESN